MTNRSKNKRVDIRLDYTTHKLLESLALRFNTTKTEIIKQAVMLYAGSKKHIMKIAFYDADKTELSKEETEELIKIANTKWINK